LAAESCVNNRKEKINLKEKEGIIFIDVFINWF